MMSELPLEENYLCTEQPVDQGHANRLLTSKNIRTAALGCIMWAGAVIGGNTAIELAGETEGQVCAVSASIEHTPFTTHTSDPSFVAQLAPGFSAAVPEVSDNPFLKSRLTVTDIDRDKVEKLQNTLANGSTAELKELEQLCRDDARDLLSESGKNAILFGGVGSLIGGLSVFAAVNLIKPTELARSKRLALMVSTTALAALPGIGSLAWAGSTINEDALKNPEYRGVLRDIEELVDSGRLTLEGYQEKSGELTRWIEQTAELQQALTEPTEKDGSLRILAIADVHSRPCTYERAELLARAYGVDFIINKGDEYEWAENEAGLIVPEDGCSGINGPADVDIPFYQVKGNHDSDSAMEKIDDIENVTVLDEEPIKIQYEVDGTAGVLTLMGIPDVRYTPDDSMLGESEPRTDLLSLYTPERFSRIKQYQPDILITHDPRLLEEMQQEMLIPESVKLLGAGHLHRAQIDQESYTALLLITGSSGGGGLRTYNGKGQPSQYSVIFMDPESKQVKRIELISVTNEGVVTLRNVDTSS
jgi:predicted MPP superfamily phosphohydrolase